MGREEEDGYLVLAVARDALASSWVRGGLTVFGKAGPEL